MTGRSRCETADRLLNKLTYRLIVPPTVLPTLSPPVVVPPEEFDDGAAEAAALTAAARGPNEGAGPSGRDRVRLKPLLGRLMLPGVVGPGSSCGRMLRVVEGVVAGESLGKESVGMGEPLMESSGAGVSERGVWNGSLWGTLGHVALRQRCWLELRSSSSMRCSPAVEDSTAEDPRGSRQSRDSDFPRVLLGAPGDRRPTSRFSDP